MEQFKRWKEKDLKARRQATQNFNDELAVRSSTASIHLAAGNVYAKADRLADAETHWLRTVELLPDDILARTQLAAYYARHDRLQEAIAQWEALRKTTPTNPYLSLNLGLAYARLNDLSSAEAAFRKAIEVAPKLPGAYRGLSDVLQRTARNLPEAAQAARRAAELEPIAQNYVLLATACERAGDRAAALAAAQRAAELDPGNFEHHRTLERLQKKTPDDKNR